MAAGPGRVRALLARVRKALKSRRKRLGALPPWAASGTIHATVLFVSTVMAGSAVPPRTQVMFPNEARRRDESKYMQSRQVDFFTPATALRQKPTLAAPVWRWDLATPSEVNKIGNCIPPQNIWGGEDAISDIPLGGTGVTGSVGAGGGGMAGLFGYRNDQRRRTVARFQGSQATENAVEAALRWLARRQKPDGRWEESGRGGAGDRRTSVAATGLALQAFLGAGYTGVSDDFGTTVRDGIEWLKAQQHRNGGVLGKGPHRCEPLDALNHALAGLALVEAYGMTEDPELREAAQRSADHTAGLIRELSPREKDGPDREADVSLLAWQLLHLRSARAAGLRFDGFAFHRGMVRVRQLLDRRTGRSAARFTRAKGAGPTAAGAARSTAASMACRLAAGISPRDQLLRKGSRWVLAAKPDWRQRDFAAWYWGSLATFQMGGARWRVWNENLKPALVDNQRKGGAQDGSWDPAGKHWGRGRVSGTALGAMCLEVYYRYLPSYARTP